MKEKLAAIQNSAANLLWNDFLGPRNKWSLSMSIALRVQWLFFKRWWSETVSIRGLLSGLRRPTILLLIGLGLPLLMVWLFPFDAWVKPVAKDGAVQLTDQLAWKELIQPILLFIGLPSAFILWAFRDHNASAALENQRKDINLKEFQEIQLRAAGALDEKLPAKARETLQVAAIHQLRPFLLSEYGTSFRRPAWELLRALLATSAQESGYVAIYEWVATGGFPQIEGESRVKRARRRKAEIRHKINAIIPDAVALALRMVIREEAQGLLRSDLPLERGHFDGVNLSGALLAKLVLADALFIAADLTGAHLEGADLSGAHLEGADLSGAHLEGADLTGAHLEGANLQGAHLEHADLRGAHLECTQLLRTHLQAADLKRARLEGVEFIYTHLEMANLNEAMLENAYFDHAYLESANLSSAYMFGAKIYSAYLDDNTFLKSAMYDNDTEFARGWQNLSEAQREATRKPWRERGMLHYDEVEQAILGHLR